MSTDDLCFLSIADAAGLIASRQLSPVELIDAWLPHARFNAAAQELNGILITLLLGLVILVRKLFQALSDTNAGMRRF